MHPNNQNNVYRGYSYLPPSNSTSSRNTQRQLYDPRLYNQQAFYPYPTTAPVYPSSHLRQQQYQPLTTITDLAEPLFVFDDLKFPRQRRSNVTHFPPVYLPPNLSRPTSLSDARLATANAMRERLLIDIQHNMNEIDREITSLEQRSAISGYIPARLSSFISTRQASLDKRTYLSHGETEKWPDKPRKIYSVIPRIKSQPKTISPPSISNRTNKSLSPSYIGQYHYGPEMIENEIREGDPENIDLKLVVREMPKLTFRQPLTLEQFRREQSALPQNRALIFVPEYDDENETGSNEKVEDFHPSHSIPPDMAQISTVHSSNISGSSHRLRIQDFQLLTHTIPEPKPEIPPMSTSKPAEVSDKTEANLINTMISAPVKHTHQSKATKETHSSFQQETKNNNDVDTAYFFSDFGQEGEEDLISIDPSHFTLPTGSDILSEDNISDTLIRQSQTSLLNPYSLQEQKSIMQNNNEHVNEGESKKIDAMTTDIITSTSTLPSKNLFPISIDDNMQTQLVRKNSNINQDQEEVSTTISNIETIEQSSEKRANIPLTTERKTSSKNMNSLPKRSASLHQSPYILSRGPSITSGDLHKLSTQQPSVESHRDSPIPVPLNTPDLNNIRPSTPRTITPERRNSIASLDQNILLTPIDIINLLDPSIDHFPMNSKRDIPTTLASLQEDQEQNPSNMETNEPDLPSHISDTNLTSLHREETIRPPLSLAHNVNPPFEPKPKEKNPINNQTHAAISQTKEITSLKNWRERINNILSKRRFPRDKYSHIKSRVNTFSNFEYHPKKFVVVPTNRSRTKNDRSNRKERSTQPISSVRKSSSQIFGRLHRLPNGQSKIFHEKLDWNASSKLRSSSLRNLNYKSRQNNTKILNGKSRWHSESRVSELANRHPLLSQTMSLPTILDEDEQESENEIKIFDINFAGQQSSLKFQESLLSNSSWISKRSDKIIFNEKFVWKNINYQPKKSTVKIIHQPIHWNRQSKIQITHSLTLDIQSKVKYWSEIDLHQFEKKKALFSQYHNLKWNDIITDNPYSFISFSQDFEEENSHDQLEEKSPANRPKWNSVSKTRSVNSFYNPNIAPSNLIRRGWDLDLRRKRVHKLPPLKRKRVHDETPPLAVKVPSTIDENYGHILITDPTTTIDYARTLSRRSSKALMPLPRIPDLSLLSETPRSQRPVQQEWYDELSKSRSTHRTEIGRTRHNSFQDSNGSVYQTTTPRELHSLTRNSQNSVVSGALLDSSIRSNRATELRLSKDMEEHHHHSHNPSQSMPFEIRGFRLEGTQMTVPNHATIRPLSNVSYHTSEQVKTRRLYPWGTSHQNGTSSRNSSLLPITEFRHPSFESSIVEVPQLIQEE